MRLFSAINTCLSCFFGRKWRWNRTTHMWHVSFFLNFSFCWILNSGIFFFKDRNNIWPFLKLNYAEEWRSGGSEDETGGITCRNGQPRLGWAPGEPCPAAPTDHGGEFLSSTDKRLQFDVCSARPIPWRMKFYRKNKAQKGWRKMVTWRNREQKRTRLFDDRAAFGWRDSWQNTARKIFSRLHNEKEF